MGSIEVRGKVLEVDDDGFLVNQDDWNSEVANYFAEYEGITMTSQHWEVVGFLREYFKYYHMAPMIKVLVKEIGKKFGPEKGTMKICMNSFRGGLLNRHAGYPGFPGLPAAYNNCAKDKHRHRIHPEKICPR